MGRFRAISLTLSISPLLSQWHIPNFNAAGETRLFSETFTVGTYPW